MPGSRRRAILDASAELIVERGYDGTSLDTICERAACSKSAVYHHFGNKQGILRALSEEIALELAKALHAFHLQGVAVEDALHRYARMVLENVLDDRYIAILRATISASWKHPELGPAYYHVGAGAARNALAGYLRGQAAAGALNISDPLQSADEFQGLLLWDRMLAQLVGAKTAPTEEFVHRQAQVAVTTFLERHAR